MQNSVFYFLRSALIPELRADISASTPCDVHFGLIAVMAVRTFPHEFPVVVGDDLNFSVVAADLTIIALGVKLGIHDVFVNILHERENGFDIVLHVGNFRRNLSRRREKAAGTRFRI